MIILVDTDPYRYLSTLRRLVEEASIGILQYKEQTDKELLESRRKLVWLAARFVAFPDFFADAEAILRRFAIAEIEQNLSNNASEAWKQSFQILLSGTAVPFSKRLAYLRDIIKNGAIYEVSLILSAIDEMLETNAWRSVGPAVIAGRIPPSEWHPSTYTHDQAEPAFIILHYVLCPMSSSSLR